MRLDEWYAAAYDLHRAGRSSEHEPEGDRMWNPLASLRSWWREAAKREVMAGIDEGVKDAVAEAMTKFGAAGIDPPAPAESLPAPAQEAGPAAGEPDNKKAQRGRTR